MEHSGGHPVICSSANHSFVISGTFSENMQKFAEKKARLRKWVACLSPVTACFGLVMCFSTATSFQLKQPFFWNWKKGIFCLLNETGSYFVQIWWAVEFHWKLIFSIWTWSPTSFNSNKVGQVAQGISIYLCRASFHSGWGFQYSPKMFKLCRYSLGISKMLAFIS